jgi:ClpP class serine protease
MVPARVAQRGDEQVGANLAAADLDQPFAKIDLQLFSPGGEYSQFVGIENSLVGIPA